MDAIIKHGSSIRLPYNKAWDYMKLQKVKTSLRNELGRDPDNEELSKQVGFDAADFSEIGSNFGKDVSIDDLLFDEDEKSMRDTLPDIESVLPDDHLLNVSLSKEIKLVLNTLPERERQIVKLYFGIDKNQSLNLAEIGDQLDLSRERVRQLKEIALEKIRHTNRGTVLRQYLG
jgi:RNA polymerase primary sigma factor